MHVMPRRSPPLQDVCHLPPHVIVSRQRSIGFQNVTACTHSEEYELLRKLASLHGISGASQHSTRALNELFTDTGPNQ